MRLRRLLVNTADLIELMRDPKYVHEARRAARRHSSSAEDQDEFISDAWLRLSKCECGKTSEYYLSQIRKAIHASWKRSYRERVDTNVHGISESPKSIPRDAIALGRGRYLKYKPEKLSSWYYDGEWAEYGLQKDGVQVRTFYEIVVVNGSEGA